MTHQFFFKTLFLSMVIALGAVLYVVTVVPLLAPLISLPHMENPAAFITFFLWLFSIIHASLMLGWRQAAVFFGLSVIISWSFEQFGVATGMVYGAYHYTDLLGPKIGHVPFIIPVAWFMMIYPSYVIANLIGTGKPVGVGGGPLQILWLSVIGSLTMTAWDMVMDPAGAAMSEPGWIWEQGGPYFNVPIRNFIGWLLTTFTVFLIYRIIEIRMKTRPIVPLSTGFVALPLVAYFVIMSEYLVPQANKSLEALPLITVFVMGFPLIVACGKLLQNKQMQLSLDSR